MEKTSLVVFDGLGVKHHSPVMYFFFAETTSELPATTNLSDKKAEHEMSAEASDSNLKRVNVHVKVLLAGKVIKSHSL